MKWLPPTGCLLLAVLLSACQPPGSTTAAPEAPAPELLLAQAEVPPPVENPHDAGSSETHPPPILKHTLKLLYQTEGDFRRPMPRIALTHSKLFVARYKPRSNQILIEAEALQLCRSFGADSTLALALLIGHELAHYYARQPVQQPTNFLAFDKHPDTHTDTEMEADLRGIFLCQLAGFERAREVFPALVSRIYKQYDFRNQQLRAYPSLEHRLQHAELVRQRADTLVHIYEAALQLSGFGYLTQAAECYEYVLRYYQGPEVYANLGTVKALLSQKAGQGLAFPFELDLYSKLHRVRSYGRAAPNEQLRRQFAEEALQWLSQAAAMHPQPGTLSNLIGAHILLGNFEESARLLSESRKALGAERGYFLQALQHWYAERDTARAIDLFERVANSSDHSLQALAQFNLHWLRTGEHGSPITARCPLPARSEFPGGFRLHDAFLGRGLPLGTSQQSSLRWEVRPQATLYSIQSLTGRIAFIQQRPEPGTPCLEWDALRGTRAGKLPLHTSSGSLHHFPACQHLFLLNPANEVVFYAVEVGR
jgi:tetratricopeptide (TPR) repeat protein